MTYREPKHLPPSRRRPLVEALERRQLMDGTSPWSQWSHGPSTDPSFFPIGVGEQEAFYAGSYRQLGMNVIVGQFGGLTQSNLDQIGAAGMKLIVQQDAVGLSNLNNPTIIGWLQEKDEPDNAQPDGSGGFAPPLSPDTIVARYNQIRAADPTRPVLLDLGQGVAWDDWYGRGTRTNHPEDYPLYMNGADIGAFDIYPASWVNTAVYGQLWRVPYGVDRLRQWAGPQRPVFAWIETSNVYGASATPDQVKTEVWGALIHGASGIIYFAHQLVPTFDAAALLHEPVMAAAVTAIDQQINALAPVLNSPTVGDVSVTTSNPAAPVDAMEKQYNGDTYVFAADMQNGGATATITVGHLPAQCTAEVIGENRQIAVVNGVFQDTFAGGGVHLYRIVGTSPDAPAAVAAVRAAPTQVNLNWVAATGAATYDVQREADGEGDFTTIASALPGTAFIDSAAGAGVTYRYRVRAANGSGASAFTPVADAAPMLVAAAAPQVLTSQLDPTVMTQDYDLTLDATSRVNVSVGGSRSPTVLMLVDENGNVLRQTKPTRSHTLAQRLGPGHYTLRLLLASARATPVRLRFSSTRVKPPHHKA